MINMKIEKDIKAWIDKEFYSKEVGNLAFYFASKCIKEKKLDWEKPKDKKQIIRYVKIRIWAQNNIYNKESRETAVFIALNHIEEKKLDWDTQKDRKKIIKNVKDFFGDDEGFRSNIDPDIQNQFSNDDPFNIDAEWSDDDIPNEKTNNTEHIDLPAETKAVIEKTISEAYESPLLHNLSRLGFLKQIRKAKARLWVKKFRDRWPGN